MYITTSTRAPSRRRNPSAKLAMKAAWKLVRRAQAIFGGNARLYIAEALRQAWAELNADPVELECRRLIAQLRAAPKRSYTRDYRREAYLAASW